LGKSKSAEIEGMQVVILAGGIGTRLKPITERIPKPMVSINGRPFLEYQIEMIKTFNLKKILLLVSYLGGQIEDYFGDGSDLEMNVDYSYEESPLGTGGALKNAEGKLDDEFLLLNGDTYLPIDYCELVDSFYSCNCRGMITVYDNALKIVRNNIAFNELNVVTAYNKKNAEGMTHVDAGAMILKKDILEMIPGSKICSLEEEIFCQLIEKRELMAYPTSQRFYDMGTFNELEVIRGVLK